MTQKDWVMNVWCSVTLVLQQIVTLLSGVRSISPYKQFCNMIAYPASNCLLKAAVGCMKYLTVRSSNVLFSVLFTFLTMSQWKLNCLQYHLSQGPKTHNRHLYKWHNALHQVQRDTSVLGGKNCCMVTNRQMKSVFMSAAIGGQSETAWSSSYSNSKGKATANFHVGMKVWRLNVRSQQDKGGRLDKHNPGLYCGVNVVGSQTNITWK